MIQNDPEWTSPGQVSVNQTFWQKSANAHMDSNGQTGHPNTTFCRHFLQAIEDFEHTFTRKSAIEYHRQKSVNIYSLRFLLIFEYFCFVLEKPSKCLI